MRDSQKKAVYEWCWTLQRMYPELDRVLTREEIVALVDRVYREYGRVAPKVVFNGRATAWARGGPRRISIPAREEWAHKVGLVLHEAAHGLSNGYHGPEYARVFLDIVVRFAGVSASKARSIGVHQKPRRVRFAKAGDVAQRKPLAWLRWNDKLCELQAAVREHKGKEPS